MALHYEAYQNKRRLPNIKPSQLGALLQDPEVFLWVTVQDPTRAQLAKLQAQFQLPELAMAKANVSHQRPLLEHHDATLFMVLHTAHLEADDTRYGELRIFAARQFLILIDDSGTAAFESVPSRFTQFPELFKESTGFALYAVLDQLAHQFIVIAGQLQLQLDQLESAIFEHQVPGTQVKNLYALKRDLAHLYTVASPVADICQDLVRLHPEIATPALSPYYRDVQNHVGRVLRSLGMLREALSDAMQLNLAMMTVQQNEVVKRLAGWGALLGVPSVIFGMYGMNFKYMPEYDWVLGYPVTVLITAYACRQLYLKLKEAGWL